MPDKAEPLLLPHLPPDGGVILEGKLPNWLWAVLARAYRESEWVACFQPQLQGSVVVCTRDERLPLGTVVPDNHPSLA